MGTDRPHPAQDPIDTVTLVRTAQRGDTLAMGDLLDMLTPYVARVCGSIALHSGSDAAQDTLIVVMRSLRSLREPAALFGWVRTIAVREAVRHAERDARTRPTGDETLNRVPARGDPQLAADIRDVLLRLSPRHRAVLVLRDLHGFTEDDAAALLDVPVGTVKSQLHRARESFRKAWIA
ncbi:RNA polymerase sigma factor [Actinomadura sp. 7K507]|uniref:RNA polymerase sigma factor n=1 Tax=Actinomadura sp. 7K507 TaxID=2530365 RepID=UPI001A9F7060|nr:RNA polymerase sigma factor [Actinomadura sp. 7K507]